MKLKKHYYYYYVFLHDRNVQMGITGIHRHNIAKVHLHLSSSTSPRHLNTNVSNAF